MDGRMDGWWTVVKKTVSEAGWSGTESWTKRYRKLDETVMVTCQKRKIYFKINKLINHIQYWQVKSSLGAVRTPNAHLLSLTEDDDFLGSL